MTALRALSVKVPPAPINKLVIPAGVAPPNQEQGNAAAKLAEKLRKSARDRLIAASQGGDLDTVLDAIDEIGAGVFAGFEREFAELTKRNASRRQEMNEVECERGCAFCCHVDVVATPVEIIRLATAQRRGKIPDRSAAIARAAQDKKAGEARTPCPLLVDNACTAYDIRPFACRSIFSFDAKLCEQGFGSGQEVRVPSLAWPRLMSMSYLTGLTAALRDLGLAASLVELRAALALLLADDSAIPRWLSGVDIFSKP